MDQATESSAVLCPFCQGRATANVEQCGRTLACPHCGASFGIPHRRELTRAAPPRAMPAARVFQFRCLRCGSALEGRSDQSGQQGKCPTCDAVFVIPGMDPRTGLALSHADPGADGENPTPMHAYAAAGDKAPRIVRREDDTPFIECPRCGRRCPIASNTCPGCGLPFTVEGLNLDAGSIPTGLGVAAMIVGILALPVSLCSGEVGLVAGLTAVMLGIWARTAAIGRHSRMGDAGIVLGAIACLISAARLYLS